MSESEPFNGRVFANPAYRALFGAAAVSNFGSMLQHIALPFLAIITLDATPADIATLSAAGLLPAFLLGPIGSVFVDRLPRRSMLVATDWARALLLAWVPFAAFAGELTLFSLHVVVALHGVFTFLFGAAHHAILPAIVARHRLVEANGRLKAAEAVSEGAAFASGGWLIQWLSAPIAIAVDAASYALSALLLLGVPRDRPTPRDPEHDRPSIRGELRDGLRFLAGHPLLLPGALGQALLAMSWRIAGVVYLLYVYEALGFTPGVLGLVFAVGGLASLLGAIAAERVTPRLGVGPSMIVGAAGCGAATLLLPLAPGAGLVGLAVLIAHQLGDGFEVLFDVNHASLRQRETPHALLGRTVGGGAFLSAGAMLLGLLLGGTLGETLGLRATLVVSGAVGLLGALLVALSPLRSHRGGRSVLSDDRRS